MARAPTDYLPSLCGTTLPNGRVCARVKNHPGACFIDIIRHRAIERLHHHMHFGTVAEEYGRMFDNLTTTQERCTELIQNERALREEIIKLKAKLELTEAALQDFKRYLYEPRKADPIMKITLIVLCILPALFACSAPPEEGESSQSLETAPHPLTCAEAEPFDGNPCDCRYAADTCGAAYSCAVNEDCALEGGGGIPFSYESDQNPGYQDQCVMVYHASGLTGCTKVDTAVCCK